MRDQFIRLLEESGLVRSFGSGHSLNAFGSNLELVKVSRVDPINADLYFRSFHHSSPHDPTVSCDPALSILFLFSEVVRA